MPISGLGPLTALDAVNTMLSALGEAPLPSLTVEREDVSMAVNLLKQAAVEVQTEGWRFNTEFGVEMVPAGTLQWPGVSGPLYCYVPPPSLLAFEVTRSPNQMDLDLVIRPPKVFPAPAVFYDRAANRDGVIFPTLKINPVWLWEYDALPVSAKRYVVILATRRFVEQALGEPQRAAYTQRDEALARRALEREHGMRDRVNLFQSPEAVSILGFRRRMGPRVDGR